MKLKLVLHPNEWLEKQVQPFDFNNLDAKDVEKQMIEIMEKNAGVGLSANQVGLDGQVFILKPHKMEGFDEPFGIFNPEVIKIDDRVIEGEEGCLSYPGLYVKKKRPAMIRCNFQDPFGNSITKRFSGISSRIFQHEFEHLEGGNFLEGVSRLALDNARRKQRNLLRRVKREVQGRSKHGTGRKR